MSLSKYYRTLGLPVGSDQAMVRKQYRKLAMRYHPDKNPSVSAQTKFIAITEAYEILMGKKSAPQTRTTRHSSPSTRTADPGITSDRNAKSRAERVREARERQEEQNKREAEENERYFIRLTSGWRWKVMKLSAICGIFLSCCLIAERFLPNHYTPAEITRFKYNAGFSSGNDNISIVETHTDTYWASQFNSDIYYQSPRLSVRSSWIFHEPIELISVRKLELKPYDVHFTFYSTYLLFVLIFLLPTVTYFTKNRTILFTVMHQTSLYGVSLLMIYFFLRNDHWAHLLTLGFL